MKWHTERNHYGPLLNICDENGNAFIKDKADYVAYLIAAAPDMLEALKGDVMEIANLANMVDGKLTDEYMTSVYAAIAKAEGK